VKVDLVLGLDLFFFSRRSFTRSVSVYTFYLHPSAEYVLLFTGGQRQRLKSRRVNLVSEIERFVTIHAARSHATYLYIPPIHTSYSLNVYSYSQAANVSGGSIVKVDLLGLGLTHTLYTLPVDLCGFHILLRFTRIF